MFYLYTMRNAIFSLLLFFPYLTSVGQSEDAITLRENARKFMSQGDYANATIILVRANELAPFATPISKDLAICYYMQNDNAKALNVIRPLLDRENADEQTFQIAGTIYQKMNQPKDADRVYKRALKAFPKSGPLYNDYGDLLWAQKDYSAITQWETGIKESPQFPGNYFNAAKYYFLSQNKVWSLIYGEIFVNLEPHTSRTAETKNLLREGYKKLYSQPNLLSDIRGKNSFEVAYLTDMNKQNDIVVRGLNTETLTMIRTRFILNWFDTAGRQFPLELFNAQKYMLENGLFQAYNQWLFEASQNLNSFQNWTATHGEEYGLFNTYLQNRSFVIPSNQFYH